MAETNFMQMAERNQNVAVDVIDGVVERRQQDRQTRGLVQVVLQEMYNNDALQREANGEGAVELPYRGLDDAQLRNCRELGLDFARFCDTMDEQYGPQIDERVRRCNIVLYNIVEAIDAVKAVLGGLFEGGITMTKLGMLLNVGYKLAKRLGGNTITVAMPFVADVLVRYINTEQVYTDYTVYTNGMLQSIGDWIEQQGGWRPAVDAAVHNGQLVRPGIRPTDMMLLIGVNMVMFLVMWMRRQ